MNLLQIVYASTKFAEKFKNSSWVHHAHTFQELVLQSILFLSEDIQTLQHRNLTAFSSLEPAHDTFVYVFVATVTQISVVNRFNKSHTESAEESAALGTT